MVLRSIRLAWNGRLYQVSHIIFGWMELEMAQLDRLVFRCSQLRRRLFRQNVGCAGDLTMHRPGNMNAVVIDSVLEKSQDD
jgi:hypothetical protein